jgi:hypothetical protein
MTPESVAAIHAFTLVTMLTTNVLVKDAPDGFCNS